MPTLLFESSNSPPALLDVWADEVSRALTHHPVAVIAIDKPLAKTEPARLTSTLIAAVRKVLQSVPVGQLNIEGGATAVALLRVTGWRQLQVLHELAQGVVTLRAEPDSMVITMKPGSYRWPETLLDGKRV